MSDNVKINVFFVFAYRGVNKAVRRLDGARNLPFGKKGAYYEKESSE